jgi:hypothetical protein
MARIIGTVEGTEKRWTARIEVFSSRLNHPSREIKVYRENLIVDGENILSCEFDSAPISLSWEQLQGALEAAYPDKYTDLEADMIALIDNLEAAAEEEEEEE